MLIIITCIQHDFWSVLSRHHIIYRSWQTTGKVFLTKSHGCTPVSYNITIGRWAPSFQHVTIDLAYPTPFKHKISNKLWPKLFNARYMNRLDDWEQKLFTKQHDLRNKRGEKKNKTKRVDISTVVQAHQ